MEILYYIILYCTYARNGRKSRRCGGRSEEDAVVLAPLTPRYARARPREKQKKKKQRVQTTFVFVWTAARPPSAARVAQRVPFVRKKRPAGTGRRGRDRDSGRARSKRVIFVYTFYLFFVLFSISYGSRSNDNDNTIKKLKKKNHFTIFRYVDRRNRIGKSRLFLGSAQKNYFVFIGSGDIGANPRGA